MRFLRHVKTQQHLDAFADGELAEPRNLSVLDHLGECVDCVTELELIIWTKTQLSLHRQAVLGSFAGGECGAPGRLEEWALSEVLGRS